MDALKVVCEGVKLIVGPGVGAQYESEVIYHSLREDLE